MAEEKVWEDIRDALHQLAKQGEKQTVLLEKIAEQTKPKTWREKIAEQTDPMKLLHKIVDEEWQEKFFSWRVGVLGTILTSYLSMLALTLSVDIAYGKTGETSPLMWKALVGLGVMTLVALVASLMPSVPFMVTSARMLFRL